jgi:hypothetical protein
VQYSGAVNGELAGWVAVRVICLVGESTYDGREEGRARYGINLKMRVDRADAADSKENNCIEL